LSIQDSQKSGQNKWRVGITSRESLNLFLEGARRFREIKPDIAFDIVEDNVKPILKMLEVGDLDMAVLVLTKVSEVQDHWELLMKEELFLAIPKGGDFQGKTSELRDLTNRKVILAKKGTAFRAREEEILEQAKVVPHIAFEINNIEAVKELVSNGLGFSFIPESMAKDQDAISYLSINPPAYRYHVLGLMKEQIHKETHKDWISVLKDIANGKD
jgi:DNA-binding transcriptional LysR family regulator